MTLRKPENSLSLSGRKRVAKFGKDGAERSGGVVGHRYSCGLSGKI